MEIVDERVADILRRKTPAERIRIGFNIWVSARRMLLCHIKNSHPDWCRRDVEREVARRLLHGAI
jgi:hypothetical protein